MDAQQGLARERPVEPVAQKPVQRADAERPRRQAPQLLGGHGALELGPLLLVASPAREQQQHRRRLEPPQCEAERAGRSVVEPLDVVDRDQHRTVCGQQPQDVEDGEPERACVDRALVGAVEEERRPERAPPRRRQRRLRLDQCVLQQIAEAGVGERALGLDGPCGEHPPSASRRVLERREQQRRLADPSLALDHQRSRPARVGVHELEQEPEFLLSADDHMRHQPSWRS